MVLIPFNIKSKLKLDSIEKDKKEDWKELEEGIIKQFTEARILVKKYLGHENYTLEDLKKQYKKLKEENKTLKIQGKNNDSIKEPMYIMYAYFRRGNDLSLPTKFREHQNNKDNLTKNIDFNDRDYIGDKVNDFNFRNGNPTINGNIDKFIHGSHMAGIIASNRNDNKGVPGINNNVKIMTLCAYSLSGSATDKDLAHAIRYAVDNGAKVINISAGEDYYVHPKWVIDAITYAEKKNVLIVKAIPNNGKDLDKERTMETNIFDIQRFNNLLMVGGSYYWVMTSWLKDPDTGYGKKTVSLLAPSYRINNIAPNNKYIYKSGTSVASAAVSGVASLLLSYYPKLSPIEVKDIILRTVDKYDIEVEMGNDKLKPFSELTSSGGMLNAYKALKLAEEISKNKN